MAEKGEINLNNDLRVIRTDELCSGFQEMTLEWTETEPNKLNTAGSLCTHNTAFLLHEIISKLDSSSTPNNTLACGLLISTPFNEEFTIFVGLIHEKASGEEQQKPYRDLTGRSEEHIRSWLIDNPRLGVCLIDKANVRIAGKKLIKNMRTNAFNEASIYQAKLLGSKGFYAKALEDSASFNQNVTNFFLSRSLTDLCKPIPMTRMSSPQMAIMLPSFAEVLGYVLDNVLKNNHTSLTGLDALNTPSARGKYLTTGLTDELLENFYSSIESMSRFFDRHPKECAQVLSQTAGMQLRETELAFGCYLSTLIEDLNKHTPDVDLPNCLPVSSLINLQRQPEHAISAAQHAKLTMTLNRLVCSMYVVELVQHLDSDDLPLGFRFANRTKPQAVVIQKLIDSKNQTGGRTYPSEKKFKPTLMYESMDDCLEPTQTLNDLEGDSGNLYAPFNALALTPDEWISLLRCA